jgi:hypothetical protein
MTRIVIDWDEIDSRGLPRCSWKPTWPPADWPVSSLVFQIVGPFLRDRERYRRALVDAVVREMTLTGDRSTIVHQFDGGERPHLLASSITTTPKE